MQVTKYYIWEFKVNIYYLIDRRHDLMIRNISSYSSVS